LLYSVQKVLPYRAPSDMHKTNLDMLFQMRVKFGISLYVEESATENIWA